ncbi:hypothetical protein ACJMK2_030577, partial [Sinanodonta woodiana]
EIKETLKETCCVCTLYLFGDTTFLAGTDATEAAVEVVVVVAREVPLHISFHIGFKLGNTSLQAGFVGNIMNEAQLGVVGENNS